MALPFSIHSLKKMRTITLYILWALLTLLLVKFSATILEEILKVKIDYYAVNLVCILALVALHYFKFHKRSTDQQKTVSCLSLVSSKVQIKM